MTILIRRFIADEWRIYRDVRLRALRDAPDAFGSTYAREAAFDDALWQDRLRTAALAENQLPLIAVQDDVPVGLAWGRQDDDAADVARVYQVWVTPDARGLGVGRQLLQAIIDWARSRGVRRLELGVTPSHPAAVRLYRSAGFVDAGPAEPLRPASSIMSQPMLLRLD